MVQIYAVRNENFLTVQFQANSEHTDSIKSDSCLILIPNRAGKAVQGIASCSMFVRPDSFRRASAHQACLILHHSAQCCQSVTRFRGFSVHSPGGDLRCRTQRRDRVGGEDLLDDLLLQAGHVGRGKVDAG